MFPDTDVTEVIVDSRIVVENNTEIPPPFTQFSPVTIGQCCNQDIDINTI